MIHRYHIENVIKDRSITDDFKIDYLLEMFQRELAILQAKVAAKSYGSPARPVTVDGIKYPSMNQAEIQSGKGMRYIRNHGVFE